ncbi:hypothetical protein LOTGIDRAFT_132033 [Lottia gigantea]|uniref:Protein kinase domain-containing protein n=1 Tax=Lottia gigantea TaxID=225164 RepID=V3ZJV9_LOTGI|nr:hypothetical protein LOTGIDRAFT_132033 [Lottia gigantea]ESO84527.1 hypothetical protein LOTGIDRAFT_132033 [Lottia gigantea]
MILEYCETGQLDKWLISLRGDMSSDTSELLQRICFDICKGMAYLASQKIVHKKLAARNVLLTFTIVPKITGFGPTKSSEDEDAKANILDVFQERIPLKWTAPECMTSLKDADQRSDVWSFGIVLWEVFSLGELPYSDMKSRDVENRIKGGYRMSKPEMCNSFYYKIMTNCWHENPKKRESFKKIEQKIAGTFVNKSDDVYYYN